jgi:two-component system chemotaxis response regulator CheY
MGRPPSSGGISAPSLSGLRILLAEDDEMATKLAVGALRVQGITAVTAVTDGVQATQILVVKP